MTNLAEIQFNGVNQQQVFEFAGPIAMEHWPDHLTLVFADENVSVAPGDYLFKDREGKVTTKEQM